MSEKQAESIRSRAPAAWSALAMAAIAVAVFALFRSSQVLSPAVKSWSPNVPVGFEQGPSLHGEPAIGAGGGEVVVAWVDSRDSVPDIYARGLKGGLPASDRRVSDPGPHFDAHDDTAPAIVVGPGGRAYAVYTDGDAVLLARYDIASGRWVSHTQVTPSGLPWYARPNAPDLASDGNDNLIVVWEDYRNADPSDPAILALISTRRAAKAAP